MSASSDGQEETLLECFESSPGEQYLYIVGGGKSRWKFSLDTDKNTQLVCAKSPDDGAPVVDVADGFSPNVWPLWSKVEHDSSIVHERDPSDLRDCPAPP